MGRSSSPMTRTRWSILMIHVFSLNLWSIFETKWNWYNKTWLQMSTRFHRLGRHERRWATRMHWCWRMQWSNSWMLAYWCMWQHRRFIYLHLSRVLFWWRLELFWYRWMLRRDSQLFTWRFWSVNVCLCPRQRSRNGPEVSAFLVSHMWKHRTEFSL